MQIVLYDTVHCILIEVQTELFWKTYKINGQLPFLSRYENFDRTLKRPVKTNFQMGRCADGAVVGLHGIVVDHTAAVGRHAGEKMSNQTLVDAVVVLGR